MQAGYKLSLSLISGCRQPQPGPRVTWVARDALESEVSDR